LVQGALTLNKNKYGIKMLQHKINFDDVHCNLCQSSAVTALAIRKDIGLSKSDNKDTFLFHLIGSAPK